MKAQMYPYDRVRVVVLGVILMLFPVAVQAQSVFTWHNDMQRTGRNLRETILTPANVNTTQFGKLFTLSVDGQIFAQPLYGSNITIPGHGVHNVVWVATENDSVYAFDAGAAGPPLWQVNLGTAVPCTDFGSPCQNIQPTIGITATPVIDPTSQTLYTTAFTKENGSYIWRLHALDATNGTEKFGGPVLIQGSVPGTGVGCVGGTCTFDPFWQNIRPGLLLMNGVVYIGSATLHEGNFHGWLFAYNATTLAQVAVFNSTPNAVRGGFWGSGAGPVADPGGNVIYALSADGDFDANTGGVDYGDTFLKLGTTTGLTVLDYFTPDNQASLDQGDIDLGAGGLVLLPKEVGASHPEIVGAGKQGIIYVVNTANMGKYNPNQNNVIQTVTGSANMCGGGTGTPTYFNFAVYFAGCGDSLKMFSVVNGLLSTVPVSQTTIIFQTGATPSISANGSTNGIVWVISFLGTRQSILAAFDASDVSKLLYSSAQNPTRDAVGGSHFNVPTVAGGKVYVGTYNGLLVYGLL
jgi:hypothetical protein